MRQCAFRVASHRDQFGRYSDCDFFRRYGPNVQSNGSMHTLEEVGRQTFFLQFLENSNRLALGTYHANVACGSVYRPAQDAHIVAVAAGDDHNVRGLIGRESRHHLVEIFRV